MTELDKQEEFERQLQSVIRRCCYEFDMSYATVLGTLECVKASILEDFLNDHGIDEWEE